MYVNFFLNVCVGEMGIAEMEVGELETPCTIISSSPPTRMCTLYIYIVGLGRLID